MEKIKILCIKYKLDTNATLEQKVYRLKTLGLSLRAYRDL
jgi:hypothetical protein